jgi:hypothetical protein
MQPPYIFDTNSFTVLSNYYPDHFKTFWKQFEAGIAAGQILSCKEVYSELESYSKNWIWGWAQASKPLFEPPTADEAAFVAEIFAVPHFQSLIGAEKILKGSHVADPFVIASARVRKGTVVTEEKLKPKATKIPNVCEHFGVGCTNVEGFLKQNGWEF